MPTLGDPVRLATIRVPEFDFLAQLARRLNDHCPAELSTLGDIGILTFPKTALFCSARCPGSVILQAYDQAVRWRDAGRCIISGFHSPVEQECFQILMRGTQPIVICPARALPRRIPTEWREPLTAGRLLVLSGFPETAKRATAELAIRRNELVAALADEAWFAHITPGGQSERLSKLLTNWDLPFSSLASDGHLATTVKRG